MVEAMRQRRIRTAAQACLVGILVGLVTISLDAQGTLSNQVLQLLSRTNAWTGQDTFYNLRVADTGIPGDTTNRLYNDGGTLYWNGEEVAGGGGGGSNHNLLSTTHPDTVAASVTRGDLLVGSAAPKWVRLAVGTAGQFLRSDGTDVAWSADGSALTNLPAANLTGTIAAISGVNLTNLNASNLASGTVPLARLSGITNTEIDASAAIAYSKLALTGGIVNADVNASAAIAYSKLALSGAIVNADLSASAAIALSKLAQGGATSGQALLWNGSAWAPATLTGTGTVTSVALTLPGEFSVAGSPITTSGTLAGTWATQTTNKVFAAPSGSTGTPTFRALVNADFPTSGVSAGTYTSLTVNAQGIATAGGAINYSSAGTGTLPATRGGLGITTVTDDTLPIGSGTAWVATALPNGPLSYNTTTNAFATTLNFGGASSGGGFGGGVTDPSSTTSGTVQNTEYTLNSLVLPASAFNANTRGIHVRAWGTTAANANAKDLKIYVGSVAVATVTGSTANGKDYVIDLTVVRTGSNTQSGVATIQIDTATSPTLGVSTAIAQTDSSTITIAVKSANTAAAAASATGKGMLLVFTN